MRAEPPEARPGDLVTLEALAVSPDGTLTEGVFADNAPAWVFCLQRPPVAGFNAVADACLVAGAPWLVPAATGRSVSVRVPAASCQQFGSEPPPAKPGEPPNRATDADDTGGYYQPVRASYSNALYGFGSIRLGCALFQAPADIAREYRTRYVANRNPEVQLLETLPANSGLSAGAAIQVVVRLAPASRETYVVYAVASRKLEERRERIDVSWYSTAGAFELDRTAALENAEQSSNVLVLPQTKGIVHIWVVVRDERGGQSFRSLDLNVL